LVRDPKTKSVGNVMKRKDLQTKLVYGDGKCLKMRKTKNTLKPKVWEML